MKPVIKKQSHYNVLLMRDDKEARTFRLHSTTLRILLITLVVLIVGGGAGIAGGVHFFQQYLVLTKQQESQEKELSEMRLQLERLVNLECLIVASNGTTVAVPLAKNEELGVSAPANRLLATGTPAEGETARSDPSAATAPQSGAPAPGAVNQNAAAAANPPSTVEQTQPDKPANGQENALRNGAAEIAPPAHKSLESEESPLRITNFVGRASSQQRVRISYELSTTPSDEQRTVAGSARYVAVFSSGERLDLPLQDIDGTRFAIARMKPMQSSARLPQGYQSDDIDKIEVFIDLPDGTTYHDSFDFAK